MNIVGDCFALVTLVLSEVTRLVIAGLRDHTGGSLGLMPKPALGGGATATPKARRMVVVIKVAYGFPESHSNPLLPVVCADEEEQLFSTN